MTEHASHKCLTREQCEAYLQPLAIGSFVLVLLGLVDFQTKLLPVICIY